MDQQDESKQETQPTVEPTQASTTQDQSSQDETTSNTEQETSQQPSPSTNTSDTQEDSTANQPKKITVTDGNEPAQPVTSPLPHGVVPDQVQINQVLAQSVNDIETLRGRFTRAFGPQYDWSELEKFLSNAQTWVKKKLGIEA